jgi:enediyne biosynthesis protein E5
VEKLIGRLDPRVFQIVFLGSFLTIGVLVRDFSVAWQQVALTFVTALATQAFWLARLKLWHAGFLSALVTSFGLSILVRADNFWVHPLIAVLAISSKFTLRFDDRHVFNPANLGAMLAAYLLPGAWISPGQWGQDILLAAWFIALGTIVTQRSRRLDIGWCFLGFYVGLISLRVLWLGQPLAIISHQLQNGGLLLFAFFMISDPLTTPRNIRARIVFTALVAIGAFCWQYQVIKPNGLIVALFGLTPLVIGLNRRWPGPKFQWRPAVSGEAAAAASAPAQQSIGGTGELAVKHR